MKYYIFLFILLINVHLFAQEFGLGISTALNINTTVSEDHNFNRIGSPTGFDSESSFNIGALLLFQLNEFFTINTYAGFTSKSASTEYSGPADGTMEGIFSFNYLSISPKLQLEPLEGLYFNTGPTIDFLVNSTLDETGAYASDRDDVAFTESTRYGFIFSAGYKLAVARRFFVAPEISYDLALTDTNTLWGGKFSSFRAGICFYFY